MLSIRSHVLCPYRHDPPEYRPHMAGPAFAPDRGSKFDRRSPLMLTHIAEVLGGTEQYSIRRLHFLWAGVEWTKHLHIPLLQFLSPERLELLLRAEYEYSATERGLRSGEFSTEYYLGVEFGPMQGRLRPSSCEPQAIRSHMRMITLQQTTRNLVPFFFLVS